MKKRKKRPINSGENKHAYELGKTTRWMTLNEFKASQGGVTQG